MKIGIYGGSFNPVHWGHLRGAVFAREALGLDRLLLVPAGDPPHKTLAPGSPDPQTRLALLQSAVADLPGLEIWDYELRKAGKSYTFETVEALAAREPEAELTLLMGTDMYLSFPQWREPGRILARCSLAVLYRGDPGERQRLEQARQETGVPARFLQNPVTDISSTQLRSLLRLGGAEPWLPRPVLERIRDLGLYGTGESLKNLPLARLEAAAAEFLKPSRLAHVLACRDLALELGALHGGDPEVLARSALLHDVTKLLDGPTQLTLAGAYGMMEGTLGPPQTLHAQTGAEAARRVFGEDARVCRAIASHTTGRPGMGVEEMILCLADTLEPSRSFPGVDRLRDLAREDLPAALYATLNQTLEHIAGQGLAPDPATEQTLAWLRKEYAL